MSKVALAVGPSIRGRIAAPDMSALPRLLAQTRLSARTGIVRMPAVFSAYLAKPGYRRACSPKTPVALLTLQLPDRHLVGIGSHLHMGRASSRDVALVTSGEPTEFVRWSVRCARG